MSLVSVYVQVLVSWWFHLKTKAVCFWKGLFYDLCSRLCAEGRNSITCHWRSNAQRGLRNFSVRLRTDMVGREDYHQWAYLQPESDRSGWRMNFDIRLKEVRKDVRERESGHINVILFWSCNITTSALSYLSAKFWSHDIITCSIEIRRISPVQISLLHQSQCRHRYWGTKWIKTSDKRTRDKSAWTLELVADVPHTITPASVLNVKLWSVSLCRPP